MWFDVRSKLAEIEGRRPATFATTATQALAAHPVSQVSQGSQHPEAQKPTFRVASVASVATPPRSQSQPAPPDRAGWLDPDGFLVGTACGKGLFPRTWTWRVVSLAEWQRLGVSDRRATHAERKPCV